MSAKVTEEDKKAIEELKEIFLEGLREGARKHEKWREKHGAK